MNEPKTKWRDEKEYIDGTGFTYYQCQCPQGDGCRPDHLYELCYSPTENKLWFWDETYHGSSTIRMVCTSWEEAEFIKKMLTKGKSHWMEPKHE